MLRKTHVHVGRFPRKTTRPSNCTNTFGKLHRHVVRHNCKPARWLAVYKRNMLSMKNLTKKLLDSKRISAAGLRALMDLSAWISTGGWPSRGLPAQGPGPA